MLCYTQDDTNTEGNHVSLGPLCIVSLYIFSSAPSLLTPSLSHSLLFIPRLFSSPLFLYHYFLFQHLLSFYFTFTRLPLINKNIHTFIGALTVLLRNRQFTYYFVFNLYQHDMLSFKFLLYVYVLFIEKNYRDRLKSTVLYLIVRWS